MAKGDIILGSGGKICLYNGKIIIDDGERTPNGLSVNGKLYDKYPTKDCYIDAKVTQYRDGNIIAGPTQYSTRPYADGWLREKYYDIPGIYTKSDRDIMTGSYNSRISGLEIVGISNGGRYGVTPVVKYHSEYEYVTDGWGHEHKRIVADVVWPICFHYGTGYIWVPPEGRYDARKYAYYLMQGQREDYFQFDGVLDFKEEGSYDLITNPEIKVPFSGTFKMDGVILPFIDTRDAWFKNELDVFPTIPCPGGGVYDSGRYLAVIRGTIKYNGMKYK